MPPQLVDLSFSTTYGTSVVDWLLERKAELSGCLVIVPTSQSGRRLRESLAERGAMLAPRVVTTGFLMRPDDFAPESVETLAWCEAFSSVKNWEDYAAIFPQAPEGDGWELGLAQAMVQVRVGLQENGHLFGTAAKWLEESPEAERWKGLARLERKVEDLLKQWGYQSKNSRLANGELTFPAEVKQVVVAGVLDLPKVGERILEASGLPVSILLAGAGSEAGGFDDWGRPNESWGEEIAWPENGSVTLAGDSAQQAEVALAKVAEEDGSSAEVLLGTGDEEISAELVQAFGRYGWVLHDPSASKPSPIAGWLQAWRSYLRTGEVVDVLNLLSFRQSGVMAKGKRAQRAMALSQLRDQWLVRTWEDVERTLQLIQKQVAGEASERIQRRLGFQAESAELALETMDFFAKWRAPFLKKDFHGAMWSLLNVIDPDDESGLSDWLDETAPVAKEVKRPSSFWLELLADSLNQVAEEVPEGRVLDVQGWLELLHDPARHLVVCGMNEGRIPGKASTDTWLPEGTRQKLGLAHDAARAARDAYILVALMRTRETNGRVDLIVGKSTMAGDVLQPSRLLLAAKGEELARRVKMLFAEIAPSDTGLAWELEDRWKWRPQKVTPKDRVSVTNISAYLTCPFRYYLERVVGMNQPDPERVEWSSRDFGNVMHDVLERWGRDKVARDLEEAAELEKWFHAALADEVAARFGDSVPLAIEFQLGSMRQRFAWLAAEQAGIRRAGWQVIEVEKEFELKIEETTLTGKIDRIDRHESGAIRVLDYKTGTKAKDVVKEHLGGIRSLPEHLEGVEEVIAPSGDRWINVQVPLYAKALERVDEAGYFDLGETETEVRLSLWDDFGEAEKESALRCAEWVLRQIREQVFWPPSPKEKWGTFDALTYGRTLEAAVEWEGGAA